MSISSKTDAANLALGNLGVSKEIANIDSENSAEAIACRRFFDTAVGAVLRDFDWPFARTSATLSLVASDPTVEWDYSYTYPTDCVNFHRIMSGTRTDDQDSRVPHAIYYGASGKLIYTDMEDAVGVYTKLVNSPSLWDEDFSVAFSYRLAAYIAPKVTGDNPYRLRKEMLEAYTYELGKAQGNAMKEETYDLEPGPPSLQARA